MNKKLFSTDSRSFGCVAGFVVIAALLSLAACGGGSTSKPEPETTTAPERTKNAGNPTLTDEQTSPHRPRPTNNDLATCLTDFAAVATLVQMSQADPARGGRLYDKWYAENGFGVPATDQPLWSTRAVDPATQLPINARSGADSWRCKECHGWDYAGAAGNYGPANSHYTGFAGILSASLTLTTDARVLDGFCAIKVGNANVEGLHTFANLADQDILDLLNFLAVDVSLNAPATYVDPNGNMLVGPTAIQTGQADYENLSCGAPTACHGPQGLENIEGGTTTLGQLAIDNPWEVIHKIRFGQPANPLMGSYQYFPDPASALSLAEIANLVAYSQTLPGDSAAAPEFEACVAESAPIVTDAALSAANSARGGRLYDAWYSELQTPGPTTDHPLWATRAVDAVTGVPVNTRNGATSWRCKECHGWDYAGAAGNYGVGNSHYTGFAGITAIAQTLGGAQFDLPNAINAFCSIKAGNSNVSGQHVIPDLTDSDILDLVRFLNDGVATNAQTTYISAQGAIINVNPDATTAGEAQYTAKSCGAAGACHGSEGLENIEGGSTTLGQLTIDNPWEVLHKIRFGQPGNPLMASYEFSGDPAVITTLPEIATILAYSQTLPGDGAAAPTTLSLGGRLYDDPFGETGQVPTIDNPVWALRAADPATGTLNPRTGATTWRCKECHGWDYKGRDGAYGSGNSHYTGFRGIFGTTMSVGQLRDHLTFGFNIDINDDGALERVHAFGLNEDGSPAMIGGPALDTDQIDALVEFLSNGVIDTDLYIFNRFGTPTLVGNPERGAMLYSEDAAGAAGCAAAACHGPDGQAIDFDDGDPATIPNEFLKDIAVTNPWEALHKARFGQPASTMPPMVDGNFTVQDSVDVIKYIRESLPDTPLTPIVVP